MQKRWNIYRYQKNSCKLSANSLALTRKQQILINYIEEIIIKFDGKKMKYYQIWKKLLQVFGEFSGLHQKLTNQN